MDIIDRIYPTFEITKSIAWCGTIEKSDEWKKYWNMNRFKYINLKETVAYVDHSKDSSDYEIFKETLNNSILFCADKHIEGSDIERLSNEINLDNVKRRGDNPALQKIGRVLRKSEGKTRGKVIEFYDFENENR